MVDNLDKNNITDKELNEYKLQLIELKNTLKRYKYLKKTVNFAFFASLLNFCYIHITNTNKDYIAGSIFFAILLSKLYLDNKADDKEKEYEKTEIMIRSLRNM